MYKIKDMPNRERPRERLEKYGCDSLSDAELLAILLRSGRKNENVIQIAKNVLFELNSLGELKEKTIVELKKHRGIGKTKAVTILAAIEFGKRIVSDHQKKMHIQTSKDVFQLMKDEASHLKQETLWALYLDLKTQLIAKKKVFVGGLNQSLIHPREVFKYAVKYSAYQIILVHNHPSGDPEPSFQDIQVTKKFIEIGKMMQIQMADHVIIGHGRFLSVLPFLS